MLIGPEPVAGIVWATFIVMVDGMGPKWELARSNQVSDGRSEIGA